MGLWSVGLAGGGLAGRGCGRCCMGEAKWPLLKHSLHSDEGWEALKEKGLRFGLLLVIWKLFPFPFLGFLCERAWVLRISWKPLAILRLLEWWPCDCRGEGSL